jgi:CSLREA domain-containing protein
LAITSDLNIVGPGADRLTINADHRSRVMEFNDTGYNTVRVVALSGLMLTGANSSGTYRKGGAIANSETLAVSDCNITGNVAESAGGGIYSAGTLKVERSIIANNTAPHSGGGISSHGRLTISESTISGNSGYGGLDQEGTATIIRSTFSGNRSSTSGGAIRTKGTMTVTQSTLSGNSASSRGGGIWNYGQLTVNQCTITGNSTNSTGGGIFQFTNRYDRFVMLTNSIVTGNTTSGGTPSDIEGTPEWDSTISAASHHNLIGDPQTAGGLTDGVNGNIVGAAKTAGGPVPIDRAFVLNPTLADNGGPTKTHALVVGGLAVDAGDNGSISGAAFDQRGDGFTRVIGDRVDIGAVEIGAIDTSLPQVSLSSNIRSVIEDEATPLVFTFSRDNITGPLMVNFHRGGTATLAEDYSSNSPMTVAFADGESAVNVTVSPIADSLLEANETVFFTIIPGPGYRLGEANAAVATIVNDDTFVVDTLVDESDGAFGPGELSLREAIQIANLMSGNTVIEFAPSLTAGGPAKITLAGTELLIKSDLTINGPGADRLTICGNDASTVFKVDDANSSNRSIVSISGLTLTEGRGGIGNQENLTLTQCTISGNRGTAVFNTGTLNVHRSTIQDNTITEFDSGAGIWSSGTTAVTTITQSTISGNITNGYGGGVYNTNGTLVIAQSEISGNSAITGAGVISYGGTLKLAQCTISGNIGNGEGVRSTSSTTIDQCTITGNRNGIYGSSSRHPVPLTLTNTIVAGNASDLRWTNATVQARNNLIGNPSSASGLVDGVDGNIVGHVSGTGRTILNVASVLNPTLAVNGGPTKTHALLSGSPAIDAGNNAAIPAEANDLDGDGNTSESLPFDQRGSGFARVVGSAVDIGAVEYVPSTVTVAGTSVSVAEDGSSNLIFTLTRDVTLGSLTVNFSLSGTATADGDYSADATNSVTFADGASTATVTVDPTVDNATEADETVILTLLSGAGYQVGANLVTASATGTILNDDTALSITATDANMPEEGNSGTTPFTFTVTRTGDLSRTATVTFIVSASGSQPADAADFGGTFPSGTLSFAIGESSISLIVNVRGDSEIELDESFAVTFSNSVGDNIVTASAIGVILSEVL